MRCSVAINIDKGTDMKTCVKCNSEEVKIGFAKKVNGDIAYPYYCESCGFVEKQYVSKTIAMSLNYELKEVYFNSYFRQKNYCAVCGSSDVELHHFAPTHLFGSESDKWPKAYLCRKHHKQWHDLVTPNMCVKK